MLPPRFFLQMVKIDGDGDRLIRLIPIKNLAKGKQQIHYTE